MNPTETNSPAKQAYDSRKEHKQLYEYQKMFEQDAASGKTYTRSQVAKQAANWKGILGFSLIAAFLIWGGVDMAEKNRWLLVAEAVVATIGTFFAFWTRRNHVVDTAALAQRLQTRRVMASQYQVLIAVGVILGIILSVIGTNPPSILFVLIGSFFGGLVLIEVYYKLS